MKGLMIGLGVVAAIFPLTDAKPAQNINQAINDVVRGLHPEIPFNRASVELLRLTAAVESDFGRKTVVEDQTMTQSYGVFQLTPRTTTEIQNYIDSKPALSKLVRPLIKKSKFHLDATLALVYYSYRFDIDTLSVSEKPTNNEIINLACIWKQKYNTYKGAGHLNSAINKYWQYCG
jgi:hypothetical protein